VQSRLSREARPSNKRALDISCENPLATPKGGRMLSKNQNEWRVERLEGPYRKRPNKMGRQPTIFLAGKLEGGEGEELSAQKGMGRRDRQIFSASLTTKKKEETARTRKGGVGDFFLKGYISSRKKAAP